MPHVVTSTSGKVTLFIIDKNENFPGILTLAAQAAPFKSIIRFAGGCKGMSPADKRAMMDFMRIALRDFQGVAMSGGTSMLDGSGELDPMVTDIPAMLAQAYPGIVTISTAPRTALLTIHDNMQVWLDDWGTRFNGGVDVIVLIQDGGVGKLDWDGDLDAYLSFMTVLSQNAGFVPALIVWNGGAVTITEAMRARDLGMYVIVISGSGRAADNELAPENFYGANVYHIGKDSPAGLFGLLCRLQLIQ